MPDTLILALHHSQGAADAIRSAVVAAGHHATIGRKVFGDLSSAYRNAAVRHRHHGEGMIAALAEECGVSAPVESFDRVLLVSWSAGYAWVDEALDNGERIDGWVALDSGYGQPRQGVIDLAARARVGAAVYFAIYTDIETRAAGYASTMEYLATVRARVGEPEGLFRVEHQIHDKAVLADALKRQRSAHAAKTLGEPHSETDLDAVGAFWRGEHVAAYKRGPALVISALSAMGRWPAVGEAPLVLAAQRAPL